MLPRPWQAEEGDRKLGVKTGIPHEKPKFVEEP
jgi:hypothetical protein